MRGWRPALRDETDGWQRDGWRDQRENSWRERSEYKIDLAAERSMK